MESPAAPPGGGPESLGPVRYDNAAFFGDHLRAHSMVSIPEDVFYAGAPRPAPEASLASRTTRTPLRFALVLFLVGWAGIFFQASFLQQVVVGAPVFEELAKLGLALLPVTLLRLRGMWLRVPFGLASGALFGVMEHYSTYSDEPFWLYVGRIAFHAVTTGLSMAFYDAFDGLADLRARWASTAVSTLFHWANNFGAIVVGLPTLFLPETIVPTLEAAGLGWSSLMTVSLCALLLVALALPGAFRERSRRILERVMPRLAQREG